MKILIVYGSVDGQTAKIAQRIAQEATTRGLQIEVIDASQIPSGFLIDGFDGVVIGSCLRYRRYAASVGTFIREHKSALERRPSAFFSVSLGDATLLHSLVDYGVQSFLNETGWQPTLVGRFAGALKYTSYDFWFRIPTGLWGWLMGYPTDTSRDHELTDWEQVVKFANEFISIVEAQQSFT